MKNLILPTVIISAITLTLFPAGMAAAAPGKIQINASRKNQLSQIPKRLTKKKTMCLVSSKSVKVGTLSKIKRRTYFTPLSKKARGYKIMLSYCRGLLPSGSSSSTSSLSSQGSSSSAGSCIVPNGFLAVRTLADINDVNGKYIICDNIVASGPVGIGREPFAGILDGNGKTISGLSINEPASTLGGLFSVLMPTAVVRDLILENASIRSLAMSGGVAGVSAGTIERVQVSGTIETQLPFAGALVGIQSGGALNGNTSTAIVKVAGSEINNLVGISR